MQKSSISIRDLDLVKNKIYKAAVSTLKLQFCQYADIRVEATEEIGSYSEDGDPKVTSMDCSLSLGVRVIAGKKITAAGFYGRQLGTVDFNKFEKTLKDALSIAYQRALANSSLKQKFVSSYMPYSASITSTNLAPIKICQDKIEAKFEIDPRKIKPKEMTEYASKCAQVTKKFHPFVKKVEVVVNSGLIRQIFASSEGSLIDQSYATSGGTVFIIAQDNKNNIPVDLYHHTGNQLGLEALTKGLNSHQKTFEQFCKSIADEAVQLAGAKPAPQTKEVTVVLDPDLLALFAHEIIGHPSEADRALKMESGYAGRSWFYKDQENNMVGKRVGSKLLTAFSDPTMEGGYGHYRYDDEGTPAKRVYHIKDGIYQNFMNSRYTADILQAEPNGHYKANNAAVVPLIRMSNSAIAPGKLDPKKIIAEVEQGFYCVGHRIPSISESRENFQIAPRLIYEIKNGKVGQAYRDGRITADSRDFFMSIDALGNDFRIFPIPNCGKGQPMQAKQVGNGGPTARGRAKIARG